MILHLDPSPHHALLRVGLEHPPTCPPAPPRHVHLIPPDTKWTTHGGVSDLIDGTNTPNMGGGVHKYPPCALPKGNLRRAGEPAEQAHGSRNRRIWGTKDSIDLEATIVAVVWSGGDGRRCTGIDDFRGIMLVCMPLGGERGSPLYPAPAPAGAGIRQAHRPATCYVAPQPRGFPPIWRPTLEVGLGLHGDRRP